MGLEGFHAKPPANWNKWWILMWGVSSVTLLTLAFLVPFWPWWLLSAAIGFGIPEAISLVKRDDSWPPLTHTHPTFPSRLVGVPADLRAPGNHWCDMDWVLTSVAVGALFALLGWLTDGFTQTYAHPDPFPFTGGEHEATPGRLAV